MSDNGASQEGGPFGMVNAMGPYNMRREPLEEKIARIDDIGGPDTHSNFPLGWAMAANTPLRRYKQNTHGGGIRDPLVIVLAEGHRRARRAAATSSATPAIWRRPCSTSSASSRRRRSTASRRCRSRATSFAAQPQRSRPRRRKRRRSISRCSAIAAWAGRLEGGGVPSAGHAPSTRTSGSCSISTSDFSETDDLAERRSPSG